MANDRTRKPFVRQLYDRCCFSRVEWASVAVGFPDRRLYRSVVSFLEPGDAGHAGPDTSGGQGRANV
jgi:hypothetical protein